MLSRPVTPGGVVVFCFAAGAAVAGAIRLTEVVGTTSLIRKEKKLRNLFDLCPVVKAGE